MSNEEQRSTLKSLSTRARRSRQRQRLLAQLREGTLKAFHWGEQIDRNGPCEIRFRPIDRRVLEIGRGRRRQ